MYIISFKEASLLNLGLSVDYLNIICNTWYVYKIDS